MVPKRADVGIGPYKHMQRNEQGGQGCPPLQDTVHDHSRSGIPQMSRTKT